MSENEDRPSKIVPNQVENTFQTCQTIERFTGHLRKNAMNWIYTSKCWFIRILLNFGFSENELTLQWIIIIHNP